MSPFLEGFSGGLGEAEIDGAREKLLRSVDAPRRQQLLGADDAQRVALLGADQVLAALAPGERQVSGANLAAAREIGQQRRVFIIRMSGDHQHGAGDVEPFQGQPGLRRAG